MCFLCYNFERECLGFPCLDCGDASASKAKRGPRCCQTHNHTVTTNATQSTLIRRLPPPPCNGQSLMPTGLHTLRSHLLRFATTTTNHNGQRAQSLIANGAFNTSPVTLHGLQVHFCWFVSSSIGCAETSKKSVEKGRKKDTTERGKEAIRCHRCFCFWFRFTDAFSFSIISTLHGRFAGDTIILVAQ